MIKYRPEIDGLRTIAILPVLFFHLGYNWISGGYFGVDVFFVISGYLITTLLTAKISEGNFSMFEFWTRRIKRLIPALLIVILFFLIIYPLIIFKPNIKELSNDIFPAIFSYFNFYALFHFGDYWGVAAEKSYFLHTWSLSVEEQFYLIYPFFLFLVYKYFKNYIIPLLIITVISGTLFVYFLNTHKDFSFYLLPCRVWELSVGGILSLVNIRDLFKNKLLKNLIVLIGLIFILASYFIPVFANNRYGIGAFLAVAGVGIILSLCNQKDFLGRILSSKPFVYIGNISYSLYLWHWPIIVLFGSLSFQLSNYNKHFINLVIIILTLLFSIISYHFIENKTRKSKHTLKLVAVFIAIAISMTIYYKSDNFKIYYSSKYNQVNYYLRYYDISPAQVKIEKNNPLIFNVFLPERKQIYKNAFKEQGIITIVGGKKPNLILLGDSHGVMWANLLNEVCDSLKISRSFYTSNASSPFFNIQNIDAQKGNEYYTQKQRVDYAKSVVKNIEIWKPEIFVIACRWDKITDDEKRELLDLLHYLNSKSIKVILFNQPPVLEFMVDYNASQYFTFLGLNPVKGFNYLKIANNEKTKIGNNYIKDLKNKYNNLDIYDVYSNMTRDGKMLVSNDKEIFYFDDDHLSYEGTKFHKHKIMELLLSLSKK
ncbi:MAG: acyltransferase [Flavobacterium sp. JAD_PAG50586_2]|nr:MAG: acyltransferase [Flavobacterium sp. JAD_PAG50586_2]